MKSYFSKILVILVCSVWNVSAQKNQPYDAQSAYELIKTIEPTAFERNTNPNAQWFPEAGLGLFIHWGIHSVAALDPSWAMLKNCPWHKPGSYVGQEAYYKLADEFSPTAYDPEKWIMAAKLAGFQYAVIGTKHHDGYCLWPTQYSNWGTLRQMDGRDLIKPFVNACRKYGLKVGLYFSPRDWGNPDYLFPYPDYDFQKQVNNIQLPQKENQDKFDVFFDNTVMQLSEILTLYGSIDVLWFDGIDWPGVDNYSDKMHAWLRKIQPGMVVNPRWFPSGTSKTFGDFKTEEVSWRSNMKESPVSSAEWWEFCDSWSGHWGYSPLNDFQPIKDIIHLLVYARSFGGNYLLNIGPAPDGTMRKGYYEECRKLSKWIEVNKESVIGTHSVKDWKKISGVPMTRNKGNYYLHLLNSQSGEIIIHGLEKPQQVISLEDGINLNFQYNNNEIIISIPSTEKESIDRVIKISYN